MIASDWAMKRAFESNTARSAPRGAQQRRIMCATDLSRRSERAVRMAVALANQFDAQLTVVHVMPAHGPSADRALAYERVPDQRSTSTRSVESVLVVRVGATAKTIAEVALEKRAELIVMGAPRKRALAALIGTTAERVSAIARCPVLIVKSKGTLRYSRVVVSTDLIASLEELLHFMGRWSFLDLAPVSIVHGVELPFPGLRHAEGFDLAAARQHVTRWKQSTRAHLLAKVSAAGLDPSRFDVRVEENRPLRVVRRALRYSTPSLLILGRSHHTFMSRLFRGSLANHALLSLDCDVLICEMSGAREKGH